MRTKWKQICSLLLAFVLFLGTGSMEAAASGGTSRIHINVRYEQSDARQILGRVNSLRTQGSWYYNEDNVRVSVPQLQPLTWDYMLEKIAMLRAAEAAVYYVSGHSGHRRLNGKECFSAYRDCVDEEALANGMSANWYGAYGENLAFGHSTEESVYDAWLEEDELYEGQSHRRNMLNSNMQSIGVARVVYNGRSYWAMELGGKNSGYRDPGVVDGNRSVSLEVTDEFLKYDGTGTVSTSKPQQRPSGSSQTPNQSVPLGAVQGLSAVPGKYNTIILNWTSVPGARSYEVYYSTSDQAGSARRATSVKKTTYKFTKAKCGQQYYFWVVPAAGKANKGSLSQAVSASARTELTGTMQFVSVKATYNSVKLKWSKIPGAKKYLVEYSTDGVNWTTLSEKGGTSCTHKGRETGVTYYYRVRAGRDFYTLPLEEAAKTQATTVLGHVSRLKVKQSGTGLKVSWKKVPGVAYYEIYRKGPGEDGLTLLETGQSVRKNSYMDTAVQPGAAYSYVVVGVTRSGLRTDNPQAVSPCTMTANVPKANK